MSIREALDTQGYFELPPGRLPAELIERARGDIDRHAASEEVFLDDSAWDILDALLPIAREALDSEVAILPAFWAWKVKPTEKGWPKHRDNPNRALDDEGRMNAITLWVPVTDATTRNGCMHVVPKYWDWAYHNPNATPVVSTEQAIRAVPAAAGSVLGWSQALLHWGGMCAPGEPARMAFSYEMIRADKVSLVPRTHPPGWRPSRSARPAVVEDMRLQYKHMLYQASINFV